jgi:hypothetical protein
MAEHEHVPKPPYLDKVEELVNSIQYGSVTIIIQDGKVIQVDKTEKLRWKS